MPLSEPHAKFDASKSKPPNCAAALDPPPYTPDGDFVELLWENGQIVMQGGHQSAKPNTAPSRKSSLATMFPSISAKLQDKGTTRDDVPQHRHARFGATGDHLGAAAAAAAGGAAASGNSDAVFPVSTQMGGTGFGTQDEDLVPWVNCPFEEYYSDLLGDFPGVNVVSSPPPHNNNTGPGSTLVPAAATTDRGVEAGSSTVARNLPVGEQHQHQHQQAPPKAPPDWILTDTAARSRTPTHFSQPLPAVNPQQQWPNNPVDSGRIKGPVDLACTGNSTAATTSQTPGCGLPSAKQNRLTLVPATPKPPLPPQPPSSSSGIINFSHFSRPSVLLKGTNIHATDRLNSHDKASTAATTSSHPMESTLVESSTGFKSITNPHLTVESGMGQPKSAPQPGQELMSVNRSHHVNWKGASSNQNNSNNDDDGGGGFAFKGTPIAQKDDTKKPSSDQLHGKMPVPPERTESEKPPDTVIASSSVCSGVGAGVSYNNDLRDRAKRKILEGEESGYQSEDLEDESVGVKKPAASRVKRSRAAEVHNLSERRRRDRINEKMRALQELIPNCNKVDKASMLDEAIEYLKTLQLQIQIMSMSNGMCLPPMVLPAGMQHLRQPHLAHMPHLGLGMGMGMGMGMGFGMGMVDSSGSPFMSVGPMQGSQFPCSMMTATPGLHTLPGSTGLQMFGMPTQGIPIRMPCAPPFSGLGAQPMAAASSMSPAEVPLSAPGTMQLSLEMVPGGSDGIAVSNVNSDRGNRNGSGDSEIPLTTQATTECADQSVSAQVMHQTSNSDDPNSSSGNGNSSTGTSYG